MLRIGQNVAFKGLSNNFIVNNESNLYKLDDSIKEPTRIALNDAKNVFCQNRASDGDLVYIKIADDKNKGIAQIGACYYAQSPVTRKLEKFPPVSLSKSYKIKEFIQNILLKRDVILKDFLR